VWVDATEAAAIARCLKLDAAEFARTYLRKALGADALLELANGDCVFWSPAGCRIYAVRPTQCRTFPFWHEYVRSPKGWAAVARRCPGVNRGRLYLPAEIDHLVAVTDL
jgi:Fe-S-cluster containining protein